MDLRSATLALQRLYIECDSVDETIRTQSDSSEHDSSVTTIPKKFIDYGDEEEEKEENEEKEEKEEKEKTGGTKEKHQEKLKVPMSRKEILSTFMELAGEPITWIEARELLRDMRSTNDGSLPKFRDTLRSSFAASFSHLSKKNDEEAADAKTKTSLVNKTTAGNDENTDDLFERIEICVAQFSDEDLELFARDVARDIKNKYSIRRTDDGSEYKFVFASLVLLWSVVLAVSIAIFVKGDNKLLGTYSNSILIESFSLFAVELVWECFLSWIVLQYNIKINYTRKLGNLVKVPKYFIADFFPQYTSSVLSMTMALAINQTLFSLMFYRRSREKIPACSYVFLSQDRREDRPDTLTFQVTEDIMRFAIYFPFQVFAVDVVGSKGIIFIPIAINNIGDGLAEPVGVKWGKHKYSTTALYHKGRFFRSKFTRSYEGSCCVLITSFVVICANYTAFKSLTQFWITFAVLPFLMTIAEAKAPHTNDGPFLALVGCGFLTVIFLTV